MSSRSTVSLKLFASKRCFFVCQQNLVVELYYSSKTDLENLKGFPKATVKLQTIKGGASIKLKLSRLTVYRLIYLSVIRELKKGLCIHANTSGSDSPTDPKLGSFSRNRMLLAGYSWLLRNCLSTSVRRRKSGSYPAVFSETSERKGHDYILEPPTPELGVFSA